MFRKRKVLKNFKREAKHILNLSGFWEQDAAQERRNIKIQNVILMI
jgi:hypothetical protein